ncbi:MAG TPA: trigger factor [Candidatus Angelobacter sp.]|nr:trigger factor [Candidatus Angelobacter sp.]
MDKAESKAREKQKRGQGFAAADSGQADDSPESQMMTGSAAEQHASEDQAEQGHSHEHAGHDHAGHSHVPASVPPMEEACKREVAVEIPAEVVTKQQDAIVQEYAKQARIPGFRKGKVPASVVRQRFTNEITSDLVESLVPQYFREAVVKAGYRPVSQPAIYGLEFTPGEPMKFKAAFEVLPEFELSDYNDIKVEKTAIKVSDEEVDAEIKQLQERQASFDPVNDDRGAQNGEFVQVSFEAKPKGVDDAESGEPKEDAGSDEGVQAEGADATKPQPVHMDEVLVEIGGANTIPEFSEHLNGAKAGEERSFDVNYPEDFYDKRLAGQSFSYKVKVNAIKKKSLPELNDGFAQELSQEFKTLDDLKQRIRENMELERNHQMEHEVKGKLLDELVARHDFAVPRALVEHQIDLRLERGLRALAAQGMKTEDMKRMDFARLRGGQREAAVKEVKSNVLLAKVAIKENIQVSDEELDQEIAGMAQQMQQPADEVKRRLAQDGGTDRLRERMRTEKALNFLYGKSN